MFLLVLQFFSQKCVCSHHILFAHFLSSDLCIDVLPIVDFAFLICAYNIILYVILILIKVLKDVSGNIMEFVD